MDLELKHDEFWVVAVKDELTGRFMNPTYGEDLESLKRLFTYQINNNAVWKDNASDFSFYKLGIYNQTSGIHYPDVEKICSGHSVLRKEIKE